MDPVAPRQGTIIGHRDGALVVQLEDGTEVLCGSLTKIHRPWGFFTVPIGQKVKISTRKDPKKRPQIMEIVRE